jgi:hypothetical protein
VLHINSHHKEGKQEILLEITLERGMHSTQMEISIMETTLMELEREKESISISTETDMKAISKIIISTESVSLLIKIKANTMVFMLIKLGQWENGVKHG